MLGAAALDTDEGKGSLLHAAPEDEEGKEMGAPLAGRRHCPRTRRGRGWGAGGRPPPQQDEEGRRWGRPWALARRRCCPRTRRGRGWSAGGRPPPLQDEEGR